MDNAPAVSVPTIGDKLDGLHASYISTCDSLGLPHSTDALCQLDGEDLLRLTLHLVPVLGTFPDLRTRPSVNSRENLLSDVLRFTSAIYSDDFDTEKLIPLLSAIVNKESDVIIWSKIQAVLIESTPPPKPLPFLAQTPYLHTTSSFVNSSEQRKYVDAVLKEELRSIYVGVEGFYEAYFGGIDGLDEEGATVLQKCQEGNSPLFTEYGWRDWPESAQEGEVVDWLSAWVNQICRIASEQGFPITSQRIVSAQPNRPLGGSTADRKLDIGVVRNSDASRKHHWSHILVLGELKCNPKADTASNTWCDLGHYAREVLTVQYTRRFSLGFTLCGSIMRLWEFDRIGAIASSPFDINKDGLQFVLCMLGFLRMNDTQLGFDPSITSSGGKQFIEIVREGQSERLILDRLIRRAPCVAGRATTCWKAYREGDETSTPLVIKDSWQYPERGEEGKLLHEATQKGVVNVARYYHHETVLVDGKVDDTQNNVRKGLDVAKSTNYGATRSEITPIVSGAAGIARVGRSAGRTGSKRSSSRVGAALSPSKRICSSSPSKAARNPFLENRVHRRVVIRDYGKPIYKASSCASMLSALEDCVDGYQSLHTTVGLLQGDISTGNLMMNEEDGNPSWRAFLIDLDLAIKEDRTEPSGAHGKNGTRAFMAIGLLLGEAHSFMHDMESLFWVLFWICIHYDGPDKDGRVVPEFDKWNFATMKELAQLKKGTITDEGDFIEIAGENFTSYHQPLIPWVNRLRKVVFSGGGRWKKEDRAIYTQIKDVFRKAQNDPNISTGSVTL
ncbi:hypothetical protein BDV25DRAFT_80775 [Aspergillus avenaceus]|uniref:Fungal-type protein kinase domain-containing protein n=1 Tax=Aspergillus avenaceus TaxID=36643 RepID=A0A5N6U008_ASPAV|nr:hypothetical protein BDV25DRAFT_80775 [Aspergillus avenaceus]